MAIEWAPILSAALKPFIVTAHSPLASKANIVLLRRTGDAVEIHNNPEIIENWRIDQASVFELPSAHATDIEPLLQRRRTILAKGTLTKKDRTELQTLEAQIGRLPPADIQATDIIRKAAKTLNNSAIATSHPRIFANPQDLTD